MENQKEQGKGGSCPMCGRSFGAGHGLACGTWVCAKILLVLGLIALIAAWVTGWQTTTWLGLESDQLFHSSIALLILSLMCKMKAHWMKHGRGTGSCAGSCAPSQCQGSCGGACDGSCQSGTSEGSCGPECCCK